MINIEYNREKNTTLVKCGNMGHLKNYLPLKAKFVNIVSNEEHFSSDLISHTWCSWQGAELITDVLFYTKDGKLLYEWKWDVTVHGDEIEKTFYFYLKNRENLGMKSNGLVIGSHDGRNGHWIYPIKKNLSTALLIDGSEKQFEDLSKNYHYYSNVKMINTIVTVDGGEVSWYQGGEGYTDTVKKELIQSWLNDNQITKVTKKSLSINEIMKSQNFDWVHLDVEGIDADLILSFDQRPNVIIYESMNLSELENTKLSNWFKENQYSTTVCNGNTIAFKI